MLEGLSQISGGTKTSEDGNTPLKCVGIANCDTYRMHQEQRLSPESQMSVEYDISKCEQTEFCSFHNYPGDLNMGDPTK